MKIAVPTHINDITVGEFQRFAKVNVEGADPEFLLHKTIEIFCGVDLQTAAAFPLKDAEDIQTQILAVLEQEQEFTLRFEYEGVEYGFIPALEDMTLGEYIDLEEGLKDPSQMHKAAAVMFRPVVKSFGDLYTTEPYNPNAEKHDLAKRFPLGNITAGVVFFYAIVKDLLAASPHYLKGEELTSRITAEKDNLLLSMVGLVASTPLVEETQQNIEQ